MSCSLLAAIAFADDAHRGQLRADGTAFIEHPVAVLHILWRASVDLPLAACITAILHDVLEDTSATRDDVAALAGEEVAIAVDLLTRPAVPHTDGMEAEAAYVRRIFLDAHLFPYVPLVKIADRIHNLLTADALSPEKRRKLFAQTRTIYVPFFQLHRPMVEPYVSAHEMLLEWMVRLVNTHHPAARGDLLAGRRRALVDGMVNMPQSGSRTCGPFEHTQLLPSRTEKRTIEI